MSETTRPVRVLVVAPTIADASETEHTLMQWYGAPLVVRAVTGVSDALAFALQSPPDLVFAHVYLAGGDGLALCRALRAEPTLADLPIILLGEGTSAIEKIAGFASGADDYIVRPIDDRLLVARFKLLLRLKSIDRLRV